MSSDVIYLDYAATTPVDKIVAAKMAQYLTFDGVFGNPASRSHGYGWQAEEAVETARQQVANTINADEREIIFTSGATEADNLAIKGIAEAYAKKIDRNSVSKGHSRGHQSRGHIVTSEIEHKAVLDTCKHLEEHNFDVTYLKPEPNTGVISLQQVKDALRDDTILVSLMLVNNEIGTITDVTVIGKMLREKGIIFHVDAAQGIGKLPIDIQKMNIDLMSMSAHKAYGPKGIGALYVNISAHSPRLSLNAQQHGGGHERGMRSGTLPTHQIVGMGEAFAIASERLKEDNMHAINLKKKLWQGMLGLSGIHLNGDYEQSVANIINIGFDDIDGQELIMTLPTLAISSGSACNSATVAPSFVLSAIGLEDTLANGSIRFSFGRYTTEADIEKAVVAVNAAVNKLRAQ